MALTDAMQATVRTLNVPTHLRPYSHEWVQAVFTAASDAADRALNEAEALPKGEFLARYRRDYKPRIRAYLDVQRWAHDRIRDHNQQHAA